MNKIDVLIVGAGPSGLMMAAALAAYGVQCRIIDKTGAPTDKSKALVIQPRTLEIFDYLGIIEPFLANGLRIKAANPISQKKILARISFGELDTPFPFVLSLEQSKTEKFLSAHLSTIGVGVEREKELIHFKQNEHGVEAHLRDLRANRDESVNCSWLIGCDGAHSFARKALNLPFKGRAFSEIFSLADIYLDWNFPHDELFFFLEASGVLAAFPLPEERRYRLIFQLPRCQVFREKLSAEHAVLNSEDMPDPTIEEAQEILNKYVGSPARLRDPQWMANFHLNSRLTSHYRKDRVFLVGDAAHIHSPVGGQGMNTGLQDAFNLAWKLASVIRGRADPSLLDAYEYERQAIGKKLLQATEVATYAATLHNPIAHFLRDHIAPFLLRQKCIQKRLTVAISELGISYPKSMIVSKKGGKRAPNAHIIHHNQKTDLSSLWKGTTGYKLLLFEIFDSSRFAEIKAEKSIEHIFLVTRHSGKGITDAKILQDPAGDAFKAYGIKERGICLIRPDLYIERIDAFG